MNTYPDNFGMNGNMNQNGLKTAPQQDSAYSQRVDQYNVPQSTNMSTPQDPKPTPPQQAREAASLATPGSSNNFPKNMWRYGTKYEVKDDETFAFYEGYVVDYNVSEKKAHVAYENDWKQATWVDIIYVRDCPEKFDPLTWQPKDGDHIECMAKAEEYEPSGWWGCHLAREQNGNYLIRFDGWDDTHNEILGKEMLRPYGGDPPFDEETPFITTFFQLDKSTSRDRDDDLERKMHDVNMREEDLNERIFKWAESMPTEFGQIQEKSRLLHLGYFPARRNCLVMIGVTAAIQTATLALKYLLILQKRWILNEEGQRERHARTQTDIDKYGSATRIEVSFPPFLTQFLIGRNGSNIMGIRDDIGDELMDLKVMGDGKCLIIAETKEAAERAREKVEFVVRYVCVPKSTVRDIIGPRGATIKELEDQSGVTFIQTEDRFLKWYAKEFEEAPRMPVKNDNEVIMVIVGARGDVDTCAHLIQMKADHALRMEAARGRNQAAMQEWENLNGDKPRYRDQRRYVEDNDDDDFPEMSEVPLRYSGRPQSGRRRGNRSFRRTSSGGGDENEESERMGGGNTGGEERETDVYEFPEDEDLRGNRNYDNNNEDDGGYTRPYGGKKMKYVVKGSSEAKGQSEETSND